MKKVASKATEPSFLSRDIPKLILEINIDETRVEHIRLKGDEDAKIVAKKFVSKYGLNDTMLSVLEELVDEHLRSL